MAVGSVDRVAQSVNPELATKLTGGQLKENLGLEFSAQLASSSNSTQSANLVSELSVAKKFEAIFVAQMMTSILPEDSEYFGEGFAGDAWRSMLSEQLANVAVKQTDFGIASLIDQEASNQNAAASSVDLEKLGH